jgi:hypothetical protein
LHHISKADDPRFFNPDGMLENQVLDVYNGDNQMKEKDDDIAHPGMVSKPEKTSNVGSIQ